MEQCDTCLADYLLGRGPVSELVPYPPLGWPLVLNLAQQAAAALVGLHEPRVGVLHNDVRALNFVMITMGVQRQLFLKICDFGLGEYVGQEEEAVVPFVTNPLWLPPELLKIVSNPWDRTDLVVNRKTDVFSLGKCMTWRGLDSTSFVLSVCSLELHTLVCH